MTVGLTLETINKKEKQNQKQKLSRIQLKLIDLYRFHEQFNNRYYMKSLDNNDKSFASISN